MTLLRPLFVTAVLSLTLLAAAARATEPGEFYDASGRLVESLDANGVRVQYIYNADGVLVEERHSDGRRISHQPQSQSEAAQTQSED
jgi:YD repeat-containing protein